jgi:multiple sugar transport system permease protein
MIPQSFWLESSVVGVKIDDASRLKAISKALNDALDAQRESGVLDQYSTRIGDDGSGEVNLTWDSRRTSLPSLKTELSALGVGVLEASAPVRYPFWNNYVQVFQQNPFHLYLRNSAIVATVTTVVCLALGSLCAFALARLRFPFRDGLLSLILAVSMFPPIAVAPPLFLIMKWLHLLNTYPALIIPYTAFGMPLTVWTLTSFFRELPLELEESARVDGCTRLQTFFKINLPLAAPGVFTCAILVFINAWNEFMFALLFMTRNDMRTVPVGITLYPGQYEMPWGTIFAAATIVTLPLAVVVFIFQKRIIAGLTAGAVKG